jgi:hypothetical protein
MKLLLEKTHYRKHNWNICGYLKVIALLLGLQLSYTKFCCILCEWASRSENIITSKNSGVNKKCLFWN